MQMDCPVFPGMRMHQLRIGEMLPWFSLWIWNMDSLRATQNQDPVLSQVVSWLKTGVKPLEVTWMERGANCYRTGHIGEGCFWRTVWCIEVGNMKCQAKIVSSNLLTWESCATSFVPLARWSFSRPPWRVKSLGKVRRRLYWQGTQEGVTNHIRGCSLCAEVNNRSKQPLWPLINIKAHHP